MGIKVDRYETTANYTLVRLDRSLSQTDTIKELERWCVKHECGKRVNLWSFAFKTEAELTMFRLKWESYDNSIR